MPPSISLVRFRHCIWFWYVFVLTLASCVATEEHGLDEVVTLNAVVTMAPTRQGSTAIPTNTNTATYTAMPLIPMTTPTPLPTGTTPPPSSTPTASPAPTLSVEDEGIFLSELMTCNGNCDLPCWWGITPGKTEVQGARDLFTSQGIDDWMPSFDGTKISMGLGYPRAGSSMRSHDVIVQFGVEDGVIQFIGVDGGYRSENLRSNFIRDWQDYTLANILTRYGLPTYVEFFQVENALYYQLGLSYPSLGIEILYIVLPEAINSDKDRICPGFDKVDFVYLTLYPPEQVQDIPGIIPNSDVYASWESTTGLDLETFYEVFKDANSSLCVEVDSD